MYESKMGNNIIAIDVGGTTVKGAIFSNGAIDRKIIRFTSKIDPFETLIDVIKEILSFEPKPMAIGIASAGRINSLTGEVLYATSNLKNWTGRNLKEEISNIFSFPTYVINDVRAAALAEAEIRKVNSLLFISIGTGLGGGIVMKGNLLNGEKWEAGEIGHLILHPFGRKCNCSKKGCAEQYISMKVLHKYAGISVLKREELIDKFINEDKRVTEAVFKMCKDLAILIDNMFLTLDPEIIVIGGGFVELGSKALEILRDTASSLARHSLYSVEQITFTKLGSDAGIFGAGLFAIHNTLGGF
ncbi:ROK family protein [Fervidobacterium sp.]